MFLLRRQCRRPGVGEALDDRELELDVARGCVAVVGVAFRHDRSQQLVEGREVVEVEVAQDLAGGGHRADPVVLLLLQAFLDQLKMRILN